MSATGAASAIGLNSTGYGSDEFVSVSVLSGGAIDDGNSMANVSRTEGTDATVLVNGAQAGVDGLDVNYSANGLSLSFSLTTALNTGGGTSSFTVQTTGGATFQLGTNASTQSTIGIDSLATYNLGGGDSGGFLNELQSGQSADLNTDTETALKVAKKAITDVANALLRNPDKLPGRFAARVNDLGLHRTICDYVAGMTDRFCQTERDRLLAD